jgi:hypothetical protein
MGSTMVLHSFYAVERAAYFGFSVVDTVNCRNLS